MAHPFDTTICACSLAITLVLNGLEGASLSHAENSIKVGQLELGSGVIRKGPVGRLVRDGQFGCVEPFAILGDAVHQAV